MSYASEKLHFAILASRHGFTESEIDSICRAATVIQRVAELQCSVPLSDKETARHDARSAAAERRIVAIARAHKMGAECGGDPRGYTAKLLMRGGLELGIPSRGYPASRWA